MTLPAHIAGGYLAIKLTHKLFLKSKISQTTSIKAAIIGAMLVDLDIFIYPLMKDHHDSLLHTPFFWLILYLISFVFNKFILSQKLKVLSDALFVGIMSHLFLDWFGARSAGIRIFYPFSNLRYSLFPLDPEKAAISIYSLPQLIEFGKFYGENKFLVSIEVTVILLALFILIKQIISHAKSPNTT